jgi:hypothetical protein
VEKARDGVSPLQEAMINLPKNPIRRKVTKEVPRTVLLWRRIFMSKTWLTLGVVLAWWAWPALVRSEEPAQPMQPVQPALPEPLKTPPAKIDLSDNGVVLPPQAFDDTAKAPNHVREPRGEWTVSAGLYVIQPVFQTNPAFVVTSGGGNIFRQQDFHEHLNVAPQIWLGYVSERGWGVRGRWFQFDHSSNESFATAPGATVQGISFLPMGMTPVSGAILATNNLAVNVLDFQATYTCDSAHWSLLSACGIRYTHLSQDYRAVMTGTDPLLGINRDVDLTSGHNLNGAGPSFSFEIKHRLGEKGFALYGNLHGAILIGTMNEEYTALNNGVYQEYLRSHTGVLPVGEMELGAEYCRNAGRTKLFVQSGFVGQVWWGGGNSSNLDAIGPTAASSHNFGFVGLAVRAGVRY